MKIGLGLLLCFVIGAACRYFAVPVPAPPALLGALLVVAMSAGYSLTDRMLARRPGPAGATKKETGKGGGKSHG